ncbi:uncharacterized protein LOC132619584 [Lycium barbarum]|uniref:uncharacterized protein LOC132619584 n=1 Tax=Lycium barbarum TaxID=112863 RepID=UPI00293E1D44|nr:uncharacterized protein LOC132619584 [Lycium barbarum]
MDAVVRGDSDCSMVGKTILLPSTHTGVPRYRAQNYQDAMALCRWAGYPDLFLTFTCNPKWPEINQMLRLIGQENDGSQVDIICRVFEIKLFHLMQHLKKKKPFGKIIACIYTIEFQKRGLPHAHILLFLHQTLKSPSTDHIDKIISAELPALEADPNGYNAVKNFMMHGPCGELNPHCPCMKQGKCTKYFPKKFNDRTNFDSDGFPIYRRRNTAVEVKKNGAYLDNRYVVPYNRNLIVKFDAHINVELCKLLKGQNTIVFKEDKRAESVLSRPDIDRTKFTEWFEANKVYEDARELTYSDFPTHWVWNATDKKWKRRQNGRSVRRIYFAHPASGERFYMRMLLNFVKGCTSFESIRTINGVKHKTYREACYALGLSDDDKEWNGCLAEASIWATGNELRHLFVTILIHCQEINEELDYDKDELKRVHETSFALLNDCQKTAYDAIITSVEKDEGRLFFINGHGGTGKTFLWNTIISKLRSQSRIVLPVATSGIAALLLPNGRTAHSRFHIPLDVTAESTCEIKQGSQLAELLKQTSLII